MENNAHTKTLSGNYWTRTDHGISFGDYMRLHSLGNHLIAELYYCAPECNIPLCSCHENWEADQVWSADAGPLN